MNLISAAFPVFLCVLLTLYYRVGERDQWKVLFVGSLFFYCWSNPVYIIFILISVFSTFFLMRNPKKSHFLLVIAINLGILIGFKYSINFGIRDLAAPLGISYYTFMTIGYAHDCYDKKIRPCEDLFHYTMFLTYFPQILQGPIGVYQDMMPQLCAYHAFDTENIKQGGYRVIVGLFKKLVIAGRVAFYTDTVFASPSSFGGLTLIIAAFFYMIELYADFSGYMDIVCGVSTMMGIRLKENFNRPYLAKNIPEYWRRWHISLNEWFNTHLFMPSVTASWNRKLSKALGRVFKKAKKGTLRLIFPTIIVWVITGIWHGAGLHYLAWGVYFAIVMLLSFCTASWVKKLNTAIHWNKDNIFIRIFQVIRTFIIVVIGEIIFRAETFRDVLVIFKNIATKTAINGSAVAAALTPFGNGNQAAASVIIIGIIIGLLFLVEIARERNEKAFTGHRYAYAFIMTVFIALFGVSGASSFMYQAF